MRPLLILIGLLGSANIFAQETLLPLKFGANHSTIHRAIDTRGGTLTLPFRDDFAQESAFPDPAKWCDNRVYINTTYPIDPPTIGVATFDGLNNAGVPYNQNNGFGSADTLTSGAFDLSGFGPTDDIYLSFFCEPGGYGNSPEQKDTFLLQFYTASHAWVTVWKALADTLPTDSFHFVMLPVVQSQYLHDTFQFRFRNYANLKGNNDHWHLDYVFMDANRSTLNPYMNDIGFRYGGQSLLKRYQEMPLDQFVGHEQKELADNICIDASNLFPGLPKNTNFFYEARDNCAASVISSGSVGGAINFQPLSDTTRCTSNFKTAITTAAAGTTCDTLTIETTYYIDSISSLLSGNDVTTHHQRFANYFAYDDGSAEAAYGLIGTGSMLALRFEANKADTLQAVQFHFAHIDEQTGNFLFSIVIWDTLDIPTGAADNIIYRKDFQQPKFIDSINGFYTYVLDTPQIVNGTFWVGWQQSQANNLSVGYDQNSDASNYTYFNVQGNWLKTNFTGAPMIRPILGKKVASSGIASGSGVRSIYIYPNPATDRLHFRLADDRAPEAVIFDALGRPVITTIADNGVIDISTLNAGLYILKVKANDGQLYTATFVKNK